MSVNHKGELTSAYVDSCKYYNPDKNKPTKSKSAKSGVIYECKNVDGDSCYNCKKLNEGDKRVKKETELQEMMVELENDISEAQKKISDIQEMITKEKEPKKYITVVDGFSGSLKLKVCWVKDGSTSEWVKRTNIVILSRIDSHEYSYTAIGVHDDTEVDGFYDIKFLPFSPDRPPSVDWPMKVTTSKFHRHFKEYDSSGNPHWYVDGTTSFSSITGQSKCSTDHKFLNIEDVPNE